MKFPSFQVGSTNGARSTKVSKNDGLSWRATYYSTLRKREIKSHSAWSYWRAVPSNLQRIPNSIVSKLYSMAPKIEPTFYQLTRRPWWRRGWKPWRQLVMITWSWWWPSCRDNWTNWMAKRIRHRKLLRSQRRHQDERIHSTNRPTPVHHPHHHRQQVSLFLQFIAYSAFLTNFANQILVAIFVCVCA